ncbi:AAA family ATPase [Gordonia alkaliphila]|uniref:AAA family ATPase n=1 Tax=Gordonia alkaliphila TaxID=1053547 RepID=UPI001FF1ADC8|nr:AAA family ATPase [Gordonia alkaliphila]MCK0441136.1 AAA family ATPase [Gordonia alkaliphila]
MNDTQVQDLFTQAIDYLGFKDSPQAASEMATRALNLDKNQCDLWRLLLRCDPTMTQAPEVLQRIHLRSASFGELAAVVNANPHFKGAFDRQGLTTSEWIGTEWPLPLDLRVSMISPSRVAAAWAAHNAFTLGEFDKAAAILDASPVPNLPWVRAVYALMYWYTGRWQNAQSEAEKLLASLSYASDDRTVRVNESGQELIDADLRYLGYLIDGMAYAHFGQDAQAEERLAVVAGAAIGGIAFPVLQRAAHHTMGLLHRARGANEKADREFANAKQFGTTAELDADASDPNRRLVFTSPETIDARTSYWDKSSEPSMKEITDQRRSEEGAALLESALAAIDEQIGLVDVKKKIHEFAAQQRMDQFYRDQGIVPDGDSRNSFVFVGPPGTGKTVTARAFAEVLFAYGVIRENKLVEKSAPDLVGNHLGDAEKLTMAALHEADGGVLFLDEVYQLTQKGDSSGGSNANAFGKKAAEAILKYMEDTPDCVVIIAGYREETDSFLESNPGFRSRFTDTLNFVSYTPDELGQIATLMASKRVPQLKFAPGAHAHFVERCQGMTAPYRDGRTVGDIAGNGRMVRKALDAMRKNINVRLNPILAQPNHQLTVEDTLTITVEDVDAAMDPIMKELWQ